MTATLKTVDIASVENTIASLVAEIEKLDRNYIPKYFRLWGLILTRREVLEITKPNKQERAAEMDLCGNKERYYRAKAIHAYFVGNPAEMKSWDGGLVDLLEAIRQDKQEKRAEKKPGTRKTKTRKTDPAKARKRNVKSLVKLVGSPEDAILTMVEIGLIDWGRISELYQAHAVAMAASEGGAE